MTDSEYKIINNNKKLIISFGGSALQFGQIPPFEFLRYLSSNYKEECDLIFYVDKKGCWYHKGIKDISNNISETVLYLNKTIKNGNYEKVIFMGVSAGGYAAILFGSLCDSVNNVISFMPQTILKNPIDSNYIDLKNVINSSTKYLLYGNTTIIDTNNLHHILHCENIECFNNVKVVKRECCYLPRLRDNGVLKEIIDNVLLH